MEHPAPLENRWRAARIVAWMVLALAVLVLGLGATALPVILGGSDATGCSGMVQQVLAAIVLIAALVFGVPHALAASLYLFREGRGRRFLLALFALDTFAACAYVVASFTAGPLALLLLWLPFGCAAAAGFFVVRRAPPTERYAPSHADLV